MTKRKGYAALAAAVLAMALNAGSLQAADEASSLEGDSISYDMALAPVTVAVPRFNVMPPSAVITPVAMS